MQKTMSFGLVVGDVPMSSRSFWILLLFFVSIVREALPTGRPPRSLSVLLRGIQLFDSAKRLHCSFPSGSSRQVDDAAVTW